MSLTSSIAIRFREDRTATTSLEYGLIATLFGLGLAAFVATSGASIASSVMTVSGAMSGHPNATSSAVTEQATRNDGLPAASPAQPSAGPTGG